MPLVSFGTQKNIHLNSLFQRPFALYYFLVTTLGYQVGSVASFYPLQELIVSKPSY